LERQMAKAGVKMELDFETTAEKIQAFKPDILVFAAGGLPFTPPHPIPNKEPGGLSRRIPLFWLRVIPHAGRFMKKLRIRYRKSNLQAIVWKQNQYGTR